MRGRSLDTFLAIASAAVAALALAAVPAVHAANPQVNHFEFSFGPFTDPNFCGTGMAVEISGAYHGTEFLAPNQPVDERMKLEGKSVFTNPLNGKTVILHLADTQSFTVSGDLEGLHVFESTAKGLGMSLRTEHGGVLIRDAGYIVFRTTFNGDEFISGEIIVKGPHPIAESGFAAFCTVTTSALT